MKKEKFGFIKRVDKSFTVVIQPYRSCYFHAAIKKKPLLAPNGRAITQWTWF